MAPLPTHCALTGASLRVSSKMPRPNSQQTQHQQHVAHFPATPVAYFKHQMHFKRLRRAPWSVPASGGAQETEEAAGTSSNGAAKSAAKSDDYSTEMQAKMGSNLTYEHEAGINWNRILPDLFVGSCLQTADDVDRVRAQGVGTVISLQQDSDMAYFNLDLQPILDRCREVDGIAHARSPIRDFDPYSLRQNLPNAVRTVCRAANSGRGPVYIHCTAGLGRAPAVAMAWMHWCKGMPLNEAVQTLTAIRPCNPKVFAIRQATVDLLYGEKSVPVSIALKREKGAVQEVKVAGLDVGWFEFLELQYNEGAGEWQLQRQLPPGSYNFKFIVDGEWIADMGQPTIQDGNNVNNVLIIPGGNQAPEVLAARERLLSQDGALTAEERKRLHALVCRGHDGSLLGRLLHALRSLWPF